MRAYSCFRYIIRHSRVFKVDASVCTRIPAYKFFRYIGRDSHMFNNGVLQLYVGVSLESVRVFVRARMVTDLCDERLQFRRQSSLQ